MEKITISPPTVTWAWNSQSLQMYIYIYTRCVFEVVILTGGIKVEWKRFMHTYALIFVSSIAQCRFTDIISIEISCININNSNNKQLNNNFIQDTTIILTMRNFFASHLRRNNFAGSKWE